MNQTFFIDGVLPGLNEIIAASKVRSGKWSRYLDLKESNGQYVAMVIRRAKLKPIERANFIFTWVEKNQKRDKDNVRVGAKFILDALVAAKILPNDGWKQVGTLTDCYQVNADRPGVFVEMIEL